MALEKNVKIVPVTVGVLGLFSVLLGLAAEGTRTQMLDLSIVWGPCSIGPSHGLAMVAALLLLVAQIVASTHIGCYQKSQKLAGAASAMATQQGTKRSTAFIMFSLSWVTFAVSFILFFVATGIRRRDADGDFYCVEVKPGMFVSASILALCTVSLSIGAYIFLNNPNSNKPCVEGGVAMGHPQFPQSASPQQFHPSTNPQQFLHGVSAHEPQKPVNYEQQYYPPPPTAPPGYGYN